MPADDRLKLARDAYGAYESGDRRAIEELLANDFTFYSPADPSVMEHLPALLTRAESDGLIARIEDGFDERGYRELPLAGRDETARDDPQPRRRLRSP